MESEREELEILNEQYKQNLLKHEKHIDELRNCLESQKTSMKPMVRTCDASTNTTRHSESYSNVSLSPLRYTSEKFKSPLHTLYSSSPNHKHLQNSLNTSSTKETNNNTAALKNILLAELMSLQLLYSMLDLTNHSANTNAKQSIDSDVEKVLRNGSPASSTPSGYISGSNSQLNIEKSTDSSASISSSNFKSNFHSNSSLINSPPLLTKLRNPYHSAKDNLLDEIIAAKLKKKSKENNAVQDSTSNTDRIFELHQELTNQKKVIDEEVLKIVEKIEANGHYQRKYFYFSYKNNKLSLSVIIY